MASIVIFGAGGRLGSRIVAEAAGRGHQVTAAVTGPSAQLAEGVHMTAGDITRPAAVHQLAAGADVVVSAVGGADKSVYLRAARTLVTALTEMGDGAPRIIHSGGGGSLLGEDGVRYVDAPGFPEAAREDSLGQAAALDYYRSVAGVTWTYLSPPPGNFAPGERRGTYRTGDDHPVVDADGRSAISYEDYAMALVDEIEVPRHLNARFTVGY